MASSSPPAPPDGPPAPMVEEFDRFSETATADTAWGQAVAYVEGMEPIIPETADIVGNESLARVVYNNIC